MTPVLLTAEMVEALHDAALNPGEIAGRAKAPWVGLKTASSTV